MEKQKRTVKEILSDAGGQLLASAVILVVGFIVLNWSAYSQVVKLKWERLTGVEKDTPLTELIEEDLTPAVTEDLQVADDPEKKKAQIPGLDITLSPNDNRIIIPRIGQNIPIARVSSASLIKRDFAALEDEMQEALRDGVVHYPGTSLPGQTGNTVITGHSSYFPWDPGRFKDVFALLHDVVEGDKIVIYQDQDKYLYEVKKIEVVLPEDIEVLKQTPEDQLTLITCTPIGTNLKRLIVTAVPIAINDVPITDGKAVKISR